METVVTRYLNLAVIFFLIALTQPAQAVVNGELYRACKPYADSGFKTSDDGALVCLFYVRGVMDRSLELCSIGKLDDRFSALGKFGADADGLDINAVVQAFINDIASKPEDWKYPAASFVVSAAQKVAPCK